MLGWNLLFVGQETEAWSDDEERIERRSTLTENRSCIGVVYTTQPEAGVGGEVGRVHQPPA